MNINDQLIGRNWIILFVIASALMLSACSNVSFKPSVGDLSTVPDAVPKKELKSRYGNPKSYVVFGKRYYVMESSHGFVEKGVASWYGAKFHGKRTSSGSTYNMYAMTAAHKNLPLPTYVKVTNLNNGRHIVVKVNDRGPFHKNRIIDLSYVAALKLDIVKSGTGLVEVEAIQPDQVIAASSNSGSPVVETVRVDSINNGFYIQVGSFNYLINAKNLQKKLRPLGDGLIKINQAVVSGKVIYRVRIGPLTNIDQADSIVLRLSNYGIIKHRIVVN